MWSQSEMETDDLLWRPLKEEEKLLSVYLFVYPISCHLSTVDFFLKKGIKCPKKKKPKWDNTFCASASMYTLPKLLHN